MYSPPLTRARRDVAILRCVGLAMDMIGVTMIAIACLVYEKSDLNYPTIQGLENHLNLERDDQKPYLITGVILIASGFLLQVVAELVEVQRISRKLQ
jgi:hypothetical protein